MLPHDVAAEGQPQAGALVGGLGGEEGVEDFVDGLLGDADAVVADGHLHPVFQPLGTEPEGRHIAPVAARFPPLVGGVAGVADHIQEHPAQIVRDYFQFAHGRVVVAVDGEVEVGVGGPGAVVGQPGVLLDERVERHRLHLAGAAPHGQHILHDAVGPFAVGTDAFQVAGQVLRNVAQQPPLVVGHRNAVFVQHFLKFGQQLFRRFGEVLDEVQRVADFVGHAGGQLPQGRQLFAGDYLVLRLVQVAHGHFQLVVLVLQLRGQLFDQIEALHFQGVAAEHFQGGGHFRHFVAPADFFVRFQIAVGHAAHPGGKLPQAAQQHPPNEQPGDEGGADDAEHAEAQQNGAAGEDGLPGGFGGLLRAGLRPGHQPVHLRQQFHRQVAVAVQQPALAFHQPQFPFQPRKFAFRAGAQFEQPPEHRLQFQIGPAAGAGGDGGQIALHPFRRRLELLFQRLHGGGVRQGESAGQQLRGDVGVALQGRQIAVAVHFFLRKVLLRRVGRLAAAAVAGNGVE